MTRVSMGTTAAFPEHRPIPRLAGLAYVLKASRPGMWLTAVWFYLLPLGVRDVSHSLGAAADAALLWRDRPYTPPQMRCFMVVWNLLVLFSIPGVWRTASLTRMAG